MVGWLLAAEAASRPADPQARHFTHTLSRSTDAGPSAAAQAPDMLRRTDFRSAPPNEQEQQAVSFDLTSSQAWQSCAACTAYGHVRRDFHATNEANRAGLWRDGYLHGELVRI